MNVAEYLIRPNLNKIETLIKPMHRIPELILSPFNPDFMRRGPHVGARNHQRMQQMMHTMQRSKRGMEESDRGRDNSIERPAKRNKM